MSQEIKLKFVGKYNGHSFKPNGTVDLKLKMGYDELVNYYFKLPLLRSVDIKIMAKIEGGKAMPLGTFMLKSYNMDHDGEGTISLNSQFDYIEPESLNELVSNKDTLVQILFKATIEDEEEEAEDE